ncbi:MAG: hypothetical protein LBF57_01605 [Holosporaceae bacterium]|jgi:hydroxymethylglutaryl-CoA reductase (NADPH)|nr:hypothetical protein [Holosporaceae bacterium]
MDFRKSELDTVVPTRIIGPIKINYDNSTELIYIPLATFETPIWSSVKRGALVSQKTAGINIEVIDDLMTRSIVVEAPDLKKAIENKKKIEKNKESLAKEIEKTSRFLKFRNLSIENVGKLLYVRLEFSTENASGHNMVTKAADSAIDWIISNCEGIRDLSVSANYCVDKKVSAINGILGRGKRVSAEIIVPKLICKQILRASPTKIIDLNVKKNFIGSILSGGIRTANAHYANVVLAAYIATGQDPANVVETSQGVTFADFSGEDLYFSVSIPNVIVGTVGNGKKLPFALKNLEEMKCYPNDSSSSKRLAAVIAAGVLCSELSLLSALTNRGELMSSHLKLERTEI